MKTKRRLGRVPANQDFLLLDQLLYADAADVRQMRRQPLIETLARVFGGNEKSLLIG
jgi:hypothetical protein